MNDLLKNIFQILAFDNQTFVFDQVIDKASQQEIYDDLIQPMVRQVLDGFHCTVLAYGQTGTGKISTKYIYFAINKKKKILH